MKIIVVGLMALMMFAAGCNCTTKETKACCGTCKGGGKAAVAAKCGKCGDGECKCKSAAAKCAKCGDGECKCEKK